MLPPLVTEDVWNSALREIPLWQPPPKPTVVIAPHPDDETLAVGGLIAYQRRHGIPVSVIAVTDGEAAYPGVQGLGQLRQAEQENALAELGVSRRSISRLGLPDSAVEHHEHELAKSLAAAVRPNSLLVAPCRFDFHPDHEACGRAASQMLEIPGVTLIFYIFWAWHRGTPDFLTANPVRRFNLDNQLQQAKRAALCHHRSQLQWHDGPPILPDEFLGPARRPFETFILYG